MKKNNKNKKAKSRMSQKKKTQIVSWILIGMMVLPTIPALFLPSQQVANTQESFYDALSEMGVEMNFSGYIADDGLLKEDIPTIVALGAYENIVVPQDAITMSEEEIEEKINDLLMPYITYDESEDTVSDGSTVHIEYTATVDGEVFEGGSTNEGGDVVTIGETDYIDGFLDKLIGVKVEDDFEFSLMIPTDYDEEAYAGKEAVFTGRVLAMLGREIVPELTDEFVAENLQEETGFDTAEALRTSIVEEGEAAKKVDYIFDTVIGNATINEIPESVGEMVTEELMDFYQIQAATNGMLLDDFLGLLGMTEEALISENMDLLIEDSTRMMVIDAIARVENITVTEEELREIYGTDLEELTEVYGLGYLKMDILTSKVKDLLLETAIVE